jgi:hypothetical protein
MQFADTRRFVLAGLVLTVACVFGCAAGGRAGGRSQESITMPFLFEEGKKAWDVGYTSGNEVQRINEFVRPGQTVENWTDLVTVQTLNRAAHLVSVDDQIAAYRKDLAARCPGSTVVVIRQTPDSVLYEAQVVNCAQGADEHLLARVLEGSSNRFVVQYSVRGAVTMTPERRTEWMEKLMAIQMITLP